MDGDFEVVFHHGGKFLSDGKLRYEGESTTLSFDPDMWSYYVVLSVIKGLGYVGENQLWFSIGSVLVLDDILQLLCDDTGAMHMVNIVRLKGQVHLFVELTLSEPHVIEMLEYFMDEPDTQEEGAAASLGEGVECEGEGEGDAELREEGGQCESVAVLGDGVQCEGDAKCKTREI